MIAYLETNPTEEMIHRQVDEVKHKLSLLKDRYERWFENLSKSEKQSSPRKLKARFNKEHEVPRLRKQLNLLNYLQID